ncbi:protein FANTASTIC FOUR 1 [Corylus avellana]|uniref:protein FANTASTIC FOUR 1 n=1 Tax=Corylus avellana TaxID=13451 RepID=UPI001E1FCEE9|nr:protein FANTASTIC FOUR 1 [Corylus avellana]
MAACGSLQHIFENPLPENPTTLLESLSSWKPVKPIEQPSFTTEIFGELHFKENSAESPPCPAIPVSPVSSSCLIESLNINDGSKYSRCHKSSDSFSSMSSDSLQLCTEGLGFESSDDVEDMGNEMSEDWQNHEEKIRVTRHHHFPSSENHGGEFRRSRTSGAGGGFPPPISCIGKSGKPWVCFKSYRQDGRFVLKQIRIPTQEFLHACREDGRLKLNFVQPNDEILEEEEEMDDEDQEDTDDDDKEGKEDDDGGSNGGKDAESFVIAR